jgi:ectoine hydroxylase-related dioxygenase (phytanoyl-CoA dioxygenase family)
MTDKEIRFFRSAGYFKLEWSFDDALMDQVRDRLDVLLDREIPPFKKDGNGNIVKLFNLFSRDQIFRDIYTSDLIIKPLQGLLGPNIEFLLNRHNHASVITHKSGMNRFHRDVLHWSRPAVSVVIYPQDTNVNNGCTWLIPCSQYFEFAPPSASPLHGGTWLDDFSIYDGYEAQALPIIGKKGDILFFDSLVFHTPGINLTGDVRYAITAAYHASDELTKGEDQEGRVLVSGERVYRGNELNWNY